LLPADVINHCGFGFIHGVGILVGTNNGLLIIDLKSDKVKMVCEGNIYGAVPYMSFYIPALESVAAVEGPGAAASIA